MRWLAVLVLLLIAGCETTKKYYITGPNDPDTLIVICPTCHHRCR
jgi:hypothetical protein